MKTALLQLQCTDDPSANLPVTLGLIQRAVSAGAQFVLTPEVTNCVSASRAQQMAVLQHEEDDLTLRALKNAARESRIWLLIGSLALKTTDADGRFANRSFLIAPDGRVVARYDKIHMFDVAVSETETYRESDGYRPGNRAVVVDTDFGKVGLSICYDVRFPRLYRTLAQAGAEILTVPSAFSPVTGAAHWEALLRARAIETGSYVLAPAQTGRHGCTRGKQRETYGHTMAIGPWGDILADGGIGEDVIIIELNPAEVAKARQKIPSLSHEAQCNGP